AGTSPPVPRQRSRQRIVPCLSLETRRGVLAGAGAAGRTHRLQSDLPGPLQHPGLSRGNACCQARHSPLPPQQPRLVARGPESPQERSRSPGCVQRGDPPRPGSAPAHNLCGLLLAFRGRRREALAEYEEAIRRAPEFAVAHSNRGNALRSLGRFEDAVAACDEAIRLDPEFAGAHSNLGATLQSLGRFEDAVAACDEAIRLDPEYTWAHANRSRALRSLGRFDEALRLDPEEAWLHSKRGECLLLQGRRAEALASLRRAAELDPGDALEAQVLLSALTWRDDRVWAAELAGIALSQPALLLPAFRRAQ